MPGFPRDSLARKMMLWFTLVILVPSVVLSIFLYGTAAGRYYDTLVEDDYAILGMACENIRNSSAMVENIVEVLSFNRDVLKLLTDERMSQYSRVIMQQNEVQEALAQSRAFLSPLEANIVLFARDERVPVSYWYLLNLNSALDTPDYQAFAQSGRSDAWVGMGMIYPPSTVIFPDSNREMFCYYRSVISGLGQSAGVLKCGVAKEKLFSAVDIPNFDGDVYVLGDGGAIYQSAGAPALPDGLDAGARRQMADGKLYLTRSIDALGVRLMMGIDSGKIMRQALQSGIPQLLAGLASSLFILLATWTFLRSIQKRLDQAVAFTKQVREGNLDIAFPDPGENEIGQLIVSFNSLMGQLQAEARERIKHEKAEKRALRLALQYQVNPHFLFNTLNWIQMTAELGVERELLSQAITLLGKLLRYNLNEQATATLEEERDNTRSYVQLMNMRKHDIVSLEFRTDNLPDDMLLIRFLFQPICENAIQHGIVGDRQLHIVVSGSIEGAWAHFDIENDGAMISEEKLANLDIHSKEAQSRGGVGLANVFARIRLLYGPDSELTITSRPGLTRVSVSFKYAQDVGAANEKKGEDAHAAADRG
ncbi:sensor histidine kinase [Beduinella massiliensis]|uniref:sensor histidine kinase n=1 Tax=Beduinella massiliensis TaxID=1852363 RepID=UPI0031FA29F8